MQSIVAEGKPLIVLADGSEAAVPAAWVQDHRAVIEQAVDRRGAVLVRGLPVHDIPTAISVTEGLCGRLMVEREPFAPRTPYPPLYSPAEWPADQPMCMHHELSYALDIPSRLVLCCLTAPEQGGATTIADASAVLADLPREFVARFQGTGWQLTRTYQDMFGLSWQTALGTDDRRAVERYCADNQIAWEWTADGGLRTRRTRPAVVLHPRTSQPVWFNQIAFLNEWTMDPEIRECLLLEFGAEGLPFNTAYGDGKPLDRQAIDQINDIYARHTLREQWRHGDVLVVDNIRMAHARESYVGRREVVVALADPVRVTAATR